MSEALYIRCRGTPIPMLSKAKGRTTPQGQAEASEDSHHPKKDRFFDGHYVPRSPELRAAIDTIITEVEQVQPKGKRTRRAAYQHTFEATVTGIVCDLIRAVLDDYDRGIATPRSKRVLSRKDRYRSAAWNKRLPGVLDHLERLDWLTQRLGERKLFGRNQLTLIDPTSRLCSLVDDLRLEHFDLARSPDEEVIHLKDAKADYWHEGKRIPYDDTEETLRLRAEVQAINQWLDQADILFDYRDAADRTLRRYYSRGSFKSGGRLYGGFWQPLKKHERLNRIRISGEPVVYLDYGQAGPRILYGLEGAKLSEGELYAIPGIDPFYREGIKKVMGTITFTEGLPTRKPKKTKCLLPSTLSMRTIIDLCSKAHPAIAHHFGTPIGHTVQWVESEVMLRVMLRLREDNIVGLPIHDGVVVPGSAQVMAKAIMEDVFKDVVGVEAKVSVEYSNLYTPSYYNKGSMIMV